jgi:galactose mutarotase-like enzyme
MLSLENDFLSVSFDAKGAELRKVFHKKFKIDYLWNGDERVWNRCSPVLFPIVGKVKNNTYTYKGESFHLNQHGFARDTDFSVESQTADELVFAINSNEHTKQVYPFDFQLRIIYTLQGSKLTVAYKVINEGSEEMLFSIGAHPGFLCPIEQGLNFEDYYLEFEKEENTPRILLGENGVSRNTEDLFHAGNKKINLDFNLFGKKDAIILKGLKSTCMHLKSNLGARGLTFTFKGFPYMGIWTKPGPFICIEPWFGLADYEDAEGKLETKEGICKLDAGQVFDASYAMEFF